MEMDKDALGPFPSATSVAGSDDWEIGAGASIRLHNGLVLFNPKQEEEVYKGAWKHHYHWVSWRRQLGYKINWAEDEEVEWSEHKGAKAPTNPNKKEGEEDSDDGEDDELELEDGLDEKANKLFDELDEDKSGMLTVREVMEGMRKHTGFQHYVAGVPSSELVGFLDQDRDGTVTKDEFRKWYEDACVRLMFIKLDADNSGWLSPEQVYQAMNEDRIFAAIIGMKSHAEVMDSIDMNQNGKVSIEEFLSFVKHSLFSYRQRRKTR
jgi:Ca2+-binding EF-hand superfamily protein